MPPKVDSPFVGLVPYTEDDAEFFFGRARDQQRILANLFAARLSILYGASGVGKSSVLRAGIIKEVRQRIEAARAAGEEPEVAAVYFTDWKGDTLVRLRAAIGSALQNLLGQDLVSDLPASLSLKQLLMAIGERFHGDLLLILDQFEEYFLYRPNPHPDQFALEFAEAANQAGLPASFLVALRDDAVTRLDRFKPLIPNLFANYLRLEHLSGEDALHTIEEPIQRYNQLPDERKSTAGSFSMEPNLAAMVIEQVRTGRVLIGQVGIGKLAAPGAAVAVETPYLQLVMTRLWKEEVRLGSHTLRCETLAKLGNADTIVKSHLEAALKGLSKEDRGLCARMFPHLVTPSGTKIAHTVGNLTRFAKVPAERLTPLLEQLAASDKRILAPVAPPDGEPGQLQYEIYHDSLAQAVLAWQARYEEEQEREARAREKRRIVKIAVALALAFLVAAGAAGVAWWEWRAASSERAVAQAEHAEAQAQIAESQRVLAEANDNKALAQRYAAEERQAQERAASLELQVKGPQPVRSVNAPAPAPASATSETSLPNAIRKHDELLQKRIDGLEQQLKKNENKGKQIP
jgi:flagellar basal body-associated protein FliL